MTEIALLDGVPSDKVCARLAAAPGKELDSGKFSSRESSSALAVNTFGWFIDRVALLPQLCGAPDVQPALWVDVEYCARFPWRGGRHPWLDAAIETNTHLIGVESKRFEPFRDTKRAQLSDAYDRPVWGAGMQPYERVRDALRANTCMFHFVDAAQLVKHAFGLVTDARRRAKRPHLHYLFAEPAFRAGRPISEAVLQRHRQEVSIFSDAVADAEVTFSACSYREWFAEWQETSVGAHAERLKAAFAP